MPETPQQPTLFDAPDAAPPATPQAAPGLLAAAPDPRAVQLAATLGPRVHLGTSSWHFPGWAGLVWGREYGESMLSKRGLTAYGLHPLLRTVSVDRSFYRPVDAATFAAMAAQVPADFRFVVKAPAMVSDATVREAGSGRAMQPNPLFLDAQAALAHFVRPAAQGLGGKIGALVFQLSPLPAGWLHDPPALFERLAALLDACRAELPAGGWLAVEVRDAELLTPAFAAMLKQCGARYCLGLHDRMPSIDAQLPMLRAGWPGPLVCRWSLQRGLRYADAKGLFEPFDRLAAPDPATRTALAKVILGTVQAGHAAFVTINNKAEGCAPLSVLELARELGVMLPADGGAA